MQNPYIHVCRAELNDLRSSVNDFATQEGYVPVGPPFRHRSFWYQAMYRAPDQTMAQIRTAERDLAIERAREAEKDLDEANGLLETVSWQRDQAYRDTEVFEKQRDEACAKYERLCESAGMDRPDWAMDEKVSATMDAANALHDATETISKTATQPAWIQITVPTGTVDLQADEWIAEDGHLRVYRAGEEVAEFPPGQWRWVMVA